MCKQGRGILSPPRHLFKLALTLILERTVTGFVFLIGASDRLASFPHLGEDDPDGVELAPPNPEEPIRISDLVAELGGVDPVKFIPVLLVPAPIAELIFAGHWSTLLILVRWHAALNLNSVRPGFGSNLGPISAWPPAEAEVWNSVGRNVNYGDGPIDSMTHETLSDVSQSIRRWARLRT